MVAHDDGLSGSRGAVRYVATVMEAKNIPRFLRDTTTRALGSGRHEAVIDRGWWIERGPNGGYLAAIVLRAMLAEVADAARAPRTLTVHYLAPPHEGPIEVVVVIERAGRGLSNVSARVVQDDVLVGMALAAFAKTRPGDGFDDQVPPPELAAGPQSVPVRTAEAPIPLAERFETRPVFGGEPFRGGQEALAGGWIRLAQPVPVDEVVVAALTDAWFPAVFNRVDSFVAVPTIELTIHFRHQVADLGAETHCFVRFRSRTAVDGFVEEEGEVWSPGGLVLAQSSQLAAYIPMPAQDLRVGG